MDRQASLVVTRALMVEGITRPCTVCGGTGVAKGSVLGGCPGCVSTGRAGERERRALASDPLPHLRAYDAEVRRLEALLGVGRSTEAEGPSPAERHLLDQWAYGLTDPDGRVRGDSGDRRHWTDALARIARDASRGVRPPHPCAGCVLCGAVRLGGTRTGVGHGG